MAASLGGFLALNYHLTYTGVRENRAQLVYTLLLLCMGGSLVWLIVADNLARAFGLAGALALIRYRTRMRDPKDTTMVFFAMVIGMACGLHQHFNAICGTVFISLMLWLIKLVNQYNWFGNSLKHRKEPRGKALDRDEDLESADLLDHPREEAHDSEDDDEANPLLAQ